MACASRSKRPPNRRARPRRLVAPTPDELTDKELMLAIGAFAQRKGEAEARREHIAACADRRRSGLLPALRNAVEVAGARPSRRRVEDMETTVDATVEEREEDFSEYLTEATARFDPNETANWGFQ